MSKKTARNSNQIGDPYVLNKSELAAIREATKNLTINKPRYKVPGGRYGWNASFRTPNRP